MNDKQSDESAAPDGGGDKTTRPRRWTLGRILLLPMTFIGWLLGSGEEKETWGGTLKTVFYAIIIALVVRTFAYEPFNIPSGSMKPTLLVGDYLFVSKFSYGYSRYSLGFGLDLGFHGRIFGSQPKRGDVVVFREPSHPSIDFIKRLVGLPGDTIQVINGVLQINGKPVKLKPTKPWYDSVCDQGTNRPIPQLIETLPNGVKHPILNDIPNSWLDNTPVFHVPPGHYFMMGDNRDHSEDSRVMSAVGYVPAENLIGHAEFLFFSANTCTHLFEPWTWPGGIRWGRIFKPIR